MSIWLHTHVPQVHLHGVFGPLVGGITMLCNARAFQKCNLRHPNLLKLLISYKVGIACGKRIECLSSSFLSISQSVPIIPSGDCNSMYGPHTCKLIRLRSMASRAECVEDMTSSFPSLSRTFLSLSPTRYRYPVSQ